MVMDVEKAGFYHCNINSENILIIFDEETEQPKNLQITGFGSAVQVDDFSSHRVQISSRIKPPEALSKKGCDGRSHTVWQLGLLLWEMVYGDLPFKGSSEIVANEYTLSANVTVTEGYQDLVTACLQPQPEERPSLEAITSHEWLF